MTVRERYLTALHFLVTAIVIGFSIFGDDGAVTFCQLTACILALVLFEKILTRFLIGTAAFFVPMVIWGVLLIKYSSGVYLSWQYQERGVLAFSGDALGAVIAGIVIALVGVLFHKAKRYFVAKRAGLKKPLISPVWIWLAIFWTVILSLFYACVTLYNWSMPYEFDFDQYVNFLDKRVNTFAWPIIAGVTGLALYAVLVAVRVRESKGLKEATSEDMHLHAPSLVGTQDREESVAWHKLFEKGSLKEQDRVKMEKSLRSFLFYLACAAFIISGLSLHSLLKHISITLAYLFWGSAALGGILASVWHCMFLRVRNPGRTYSRKHVLLLIPGIPMAVLSLLIVRLGIVPNGYYDTNSAVRCSYVVLLLAPVGLYLVGIGLFPLPSHSPSLSPIAVGSFIFALCGFLPGTPSAYVGFVLGAVALVRIQKSKGKLQGDKYAAAGAIISVIIIATYWFIFWYQYQ